MTPQNVKARRQIAAITTVLAVMGAALPKERSVAAEADNQKAGKFAEQIVQVESKDDIVDSGALFAPPKDVAKPIAVIWIHGWGVNFYSPTYVAISRSLSKRAYTVITGNTRMHDLGNVEAWRATEFERKLYLGIPISGLSARTKPQPGTNHAMKSGHQKLSQNRGSLHGFENRCGEPHSETK